ncbi:MAG: BMP family ABC transporter substrate-binding protein [Anaerolineales bacterium]
MNGNPDQRHRYLGAARLVTLVALAATLAGCGRGGSSCNDQDVWCAGLVTDFGSVDQGINEQAWLAMEDARASGILDRIDRIETVDSRDRSANIAAFAQQRYDIVVTVGTSIAEETTSAAIQYPNTAFIGVEQYQQEVTPNLTGLVFHEEQGGYLAGALAAQMTQTGRIGAVCEAKFIDSIRRYCEGFRAGAAATDPTLRIQIAYREGSAQTVFQDPGWGKAAADDEVDDGVDVLFAAGGETADAALEEAAARRAMVIGTEVDAYSRLEGVRSMLLTSAVNDIRGGVAALLQRARDGQLPAGNYFGQVDLAPFHELESQVPPGVPPKLADIRQAMATGKIRVDVPYLSP